MDDQAGYSDAALIERVRQGDAECFTEIVTRYQAALLRVARSWLGRGDWAEDVVQETFLAAYKSSATYDPRYQFRTWLWTILLNQCRAHAGRHARAGSVMSWSDSNSIAAQEIAEQSGSPLANLLAKERSAELESLLARLSQVQADALRLRFFGGLKFQEIAETMQCSLNTAKCRVRWGLLRMTELLQMAEVRGARRETSEE